MIGFLGAGGQLLLFEALRFGPAYIVFPFISMAPVVTITLSMVFLKERAGRIQLFGIAAALCAILFLSLQGDKSDSHVTGYLWLFFALLIFIMWGIQGFTMKFANKTEMQAESIFVYMAFTAICLIPVAYYMTNWQAEGIISVGMGNKSFLIQLLNAVGAVNTSLCLSIWKSHSGISNGRIGSFISPWYCHLSYMRWFRISSHRLAWG